MTSKLTSKQVDEYDTTSEDSSDDSSNLSEESKVKRKAFYDAWTKGMEEQVRRETKTIHHVYPNGDTYDGDWYNHRPTGKGTMNFFEYKGEVSREAPDSGFFLATYNGDWSGDLFHGYGELRYGYGSLKDNDFYIGNWVCGKKHGYGHEGVNEISYEGEWCDDKKHGFGVLTYYGDLVNVDTYTSKVTSQDDYDIQKKYVGNWENGKRHGYGVTECYEMFSAERTYTTATWINDVPHNESIPVVSRANNTCDEHCRSMSSRKALNSRYDPENCPGCGRLWYVNDGSFPRIPGEYVDRSLDWQPIYSRLTGKLIVRKDRKDEDYGWE